MIEYCRGIQGLICRRPDCYEDAAAFGLCSKHRRQAKEKGPRVKRRGRRIFLFLGLNNEL
jgi:hypothetical protein